MPPEKTPLKRPGSKYFCEFSSTALECLGSCFCLGQNLNRFEPCRFLCLDVSQKLHVSWEETTESTSHRY